MTTKSSHSLKTATMIFCGSDQRIDQMIRGKDNLIDAFQKKKHELRFTVSNLVVYPLDTGIPSTLDVLLTFQLDSLLAGWQFKSRPSKNFYAMGYAK